MCTKGQKTQKQQIGQMGEEAACLFLKKQNRQIIARNYWKKWGEIDIVARDEQGIVHFIEVKTVVRAYLRDSKHGDYEPEDNLHPWKRLRLRRVIQTYLLDKFDDKNEPEWQVDVMSVYLTPAGEVLKIETLEDVVI